MKSEARYKTSVSMHTVSAVAYDSPENLVVEMTIVKLRHAEQFVGKELSGVAFSRNNKQQATAARQGMLMHVLASSFLLSKKNYKSYVKLSRSTV
jgi:hypothetical protein